MNAILKFPDLLFLENYGGNFDKYFGEAYNIFSQHFIKSLPLFHGVKVSAPHYPLQDGIHRTFYHITHEGNIEDKRTPDIRRIERIRYPRFCVETSPHNELLIWENQRGRDTRILIFNEEESYLTVLTKRKDYLLLWTAYYITLPHQKNKYKKEYEAYKNAKTA